jgi:hypothetical protein
LNEPDKIEKGWRTCARAQNIETGVPFSGTREQKKWVGERNPIKDPFSEMDDRWRACAKEEDPCLSWERHPSARSVGPAQISGSSSHFFLFYFLFEFFYKIYKAF